MLKTAAAALAVLVSVTAFQPTAAEARPRAGAVAVGVGAGILGAALIGSAVANAQPRSCWREVRPVYNRYGDYVGRRAVRVCR